MLRPAQPLPVDSVDMTNCLFCGGPSQRNEIIFEVEGSVRLPTIRRGDYKLMGDMLFNIADDPSESTDIAALHPEIVARLSKRLREVSASRPPLGDKPLLMENPLPYIYGEKESQTTPDWLKQHVEAVRAKQPQSWPAGKTPWPKAPVGARASQ